MIPATRHDALPAPFRTEADAEEEAVLRTREYAPRSPFHAAWLSEHVTGTRSGWFVELGSNKYIDGAGQRWRYKHSILEIA